jgi:hypothetical protein
MADLLSQTAVTARYKPGHSPLGHHWELFDADENPVGRTEREYGGGILKRQLWRSVTATGMDSGNDIRASVSDAGGTELVRLHAINVNSREERRPSVKVFAPDGAELGELHHPEGDHLRLVDAGGAVIAQLDVSDPEASPWQLTDGAGAPIGVVDREPAKLVKGPSLLDYAVGMNTITDNASDFAATMFRGFLFSNVYSISLPELPPAGPRRTLTVLTPVLLGHLY